QITVHSRHVAVTKLSDGPFVSKGKVTDATDRRQSASIGAFGDMSWAIHERERRDQSLETRASGRVVGGRAERCPGGRGSARVRAHDPALDRKRRFRRPRN